MYVYHLPEGQPSSLEASVVAVQVFSPVAILYEKDGYFLVSADVAMIDPVLEQLVVLPSTVKEEYPSKLTGEKVCVELLSFTSFTAHSFATWATVLAAAADLALSAILIKDGIAIAERTARTATTTTSSINEKPSSPGFFERTFCVLGFFKYAFKKVTLEKMKLGIIIFVVS